MQNGSLGATETERLRLVPLTLRHARLIVDGDRPRDARWGPGYPTDRTLVSAGLLVAAEREESPLGPFGPYQVQRRSDGVVIGDCVLLGPPDEEGVVHVSCGLASDDVEGSQTAEALRAIIDLARAHVGVRRVLADTHTANFPARLAMERAGMRAVGGDARLVYYEG